ncbi:uncharacterized protein LOC117644608 isoform X2 [Thrips palmi]|uniref:Probable deoxycytidylate deaminase n=1 Tax=Thrips palmi TaxID=161013 RepID=A0A6P8YRV8_THRPL|nr:uncharacterized protein LOC117644608 isoform X2 [Thrips palmi]
MSPFFMSYLVANRSKDPSTQVGACIVNQRKRIVGQGYNGMPRGCSDDEFPWKKVGPDLETKYFYVCHAEMNAIFNKNCDDISNCTIYTILFPCNQCTKTIIQSGISEVVYMCDKNKDKVEAIASMKMLDACNVRYRQLRPSWAGLNIDFKQGLCEIVKIGQSKSIPQPTTQQIDNTKKRQNCLPWDAYFLAISILVAKRSKCPEEQLGACIVNEEKRIVGQGYNGMPQNSRNVFPWRTDSKNILENKILYECHAELNAILNANLQVKGCKLYTITFPCNECAKAIIQSGIKEVIHLKKAEDKDTYVAAQIMFNAAKVTFRQHTPKDEMLYVDFSQIEL